jgi:nitrogen fixation protein NifB
VCDEILSPVEALELVDRHFREEELKVIGIAGPGEPLYNEETFQTLELLGSRYPEKIFCLSTNGLLLPTLAEELKRLDVSTVTVTINTLRPGTAEKIYRHALIGGELLVGRDAAEAITSSQIEGVRKAADLGINVKVNTILMPGINQDEVGEIARNARIAGACIQNITPLIPIGEMRDGTAPTCRELILAREQGGQYLEQFRLCRQCRADSVGVPGRGDRPSRS